MRKQKMEKISLAIKKFNDKVKLMNQTGSKQLALTVEEARNLHADIYILLANLAEMQASEPADQVVNSISVDGGRF